MDIGIFSVEGNARITDVANLGPLFRLTGIGFVNVLSVDFNEFPSPEWAVLSPTVIVAKAPTQIIGRQITSLRVRTQAGIQDAEISLVPDIQSGAISGTEALVHRFTKLLMTTPGTDIFTPGGCGGLLSMIGTTMDDNGVRLAILRAVSVVSTFLINEASNSVLPRSERLASATVLRCERTTPGAFLVQIRITSLSGATADAGLTV